MDSASTIILVASLFIIMVGMGLSLTIDDFKRVLQYPKAVFIGFLSQIVLLPAIAYLCANVFGVSQEVAIGIMILSACPGGPTSNMISLLAKGDTALSVTLTAVNSLITIITIPLIVNFALDTFLVVGADPISAPVGKIAGSLVVVIAVPLAIGMVVKHYAPDFALKMDKPVRIASALVLALVIIGLSIKEKDNLGVYFEKAFIISLVVNLLTMLVGFLVGKIGKLSFKQALTIAIECGNQNGTLAIHVAVVSIGMPEFAIPAAVYSVLMFFTAGIPVWIGMKKIEA